METARSQDGTTIAFERVGAGPRLVLVGGAFNDRATPVELAELLSAEFEVTSYDRRGRGDSTDTLPYARAREIEDLAAVLDAIGGPALVFGHSSGAALALLGAAAGLPISALALYEPPFILEGDRPGFPPGLADDLVGLVASGRRGDAVELFMTSAVGIPPTVVEQMRGEPFWPALESIAHTLPYDVRMLGDTRLPVQAAASVLIPVLVQSGGESADWFRNSAAALVDVLPNGTLLTVDGQAHDVAPDVVAPVLSSFFGSVAAG